MEKENQEVHIVASTQDPADVILDDRLSNPVSDGEWKSTLAALGNRPCCNDLH